MAQPRDVQRARLYRSEVAVDTPLGNRLLTGPDADKTVDNTWRIPRTYPSVAAVQSYTDAVLALAPIQRRWGRVSIKVRASGNSADVWRRAINIGIHLRDEGPVLHEIAHVLTYIADPSAPWHGPEFAGVLRFLYKTVAGDATVKRFQEKLRANRARISDKALPPATKTVVSLAARRKAETDAKRAERAQAAARAARKRAAESRPLTRVEAEEAARLLRRAVKAGAFGPTGSKPRAHALATARTLDPVSVARNAATRR